MAKKNNYGRAPGKTQISISVPPSLIRKIDRIADGQNRNRSNFIATYMEQYVLEHEAAEAPVERAIKKRKRK